MRHMVTKLATITNSPMKCAVSGSIQTLPALCALFLLFYLEGYGHLLLGMLQYHSDALIFQISNFHIRCHKIILRNLIFRVKH